MPPLRIHTLRAFVYRAPIDAPVITSFGTMRDRPAVLVRAEDIDGVVGWGEVWCNFPSVGAEHRARLIDGILAGLVENETFADPPAVFAHLTKRTDMLALQSGEPGPFAQCIAGIDIALWDLAARRLGQPLWRMLRGTSPEIGVYASGLNPGDGVRVAQARHADGFRAFKQKIGFGRDGDIANLQALRSELGDGVILMADANQGWTLDEATAMAPALEPFALDWLEEPIRADRPWPEWQSLARAMPMPLAAGENLAGEAAFAAALQSGALAVVQPDAAKWGGISATLPVARQVVAAGLRYCPHWLAGGIGLLASAHLLAAAGGTGLLEIDANANPLRTLLCGPLATLRDGRATLTAEPGLGEPPDTAAIERFRVPH